MKSPWASRAVLVAIASAGAFGCELVTDIDELEAVPAGKEDEPDSDDDATAGAGGSSNAPSTGGGNSMTGRAGGGGSPGGVGAQPTGGTTTGGSSGSGSSVGDPCDGFCDKLLAPACSMTPNRTECLASCIDFHSGLCASDGMAFTSCIFTTGRTSCNAAGEVIIMGCISEYDAFNSCAACAPAGGDDACSSCTKSSCCDQLRSLIADENFDAFAACFDACETTACNDACIAAYPSAGSKLLALADCAVSNCPGSC